MVEKIKNNTPFKTEIDGNLYDCRVYSSTYNMGETLSSLTTSFYLEIQKINPKKFLGFNYHSTEWTHKYNIGNNTFNLINIPFKFIGGERYYEISNVKSWCQSAIVDYYNDKKLKEELEIRKNNTIHKSII